MFFPILFEKRTVRCGFHFFLIIRCNVVRFLGTVRCGAVRIIFFEKRTTVRRGVVIR